MIRGRDAVTIGISIYIPNIGPCTVAARSQARITSQYTAQYMEYLLIPDVNATRRVVSSRLIILRTAALCTWVELNISSSTDAYCCLK